MQSNLIAPHLQAFFAEYLCQQRRLSPQTIVSCRDTFRLCLTFLRDQTGIEPSALRLADVDAPAVLSFLQYLDGTGIFTFHPITWWSVSSLIESRPR